jgi:hypothetical protein
MANVNAPFGLRPIRYVSGAPYNGAVNKYFLPSTYATAVYIGDPVIKTGTANTAATRGYQVGALAEVNKATAGTTNRTTGVIVGFEPIDGREAPVYGAASTARIALVADDPNLLYWIQADSTSTLDATTVGLNAVYTFSTGGSTVTGRSGVQMDGGTTTAPATTVGFQLQIVRLANLPSNEVGANAIWEVRINQHTETNNSTGI